ncbi:MAG: RdgB/HAM1 family non-canonical purine NTP pyrophosphatase [Methylococcales bacterium]|nr:RdgB/HAM1 family non-canonical purine NTP pyrophosphatase [Methylococcales bacterium]
MALKNQKIVLASANQGKIKEFQAMLSGYKLVSQAQFIKKSVEETGQTFVENALLKARHAAFECKLPAIADDSGLVVDVLKGKPGVISARYAGDNASDKDNILKLLADIRPFSGEVLTARFVCVLVFMKDENDPCPMITQGFWEGKIVSTPQGENGFGYDPVFFVDEYNCTSAQLTPEQKNRVSHRGKALRLLKKHMET